MSDNDLPAPDSEDLLNLVTREDLRTLYTYLYDRRDDPPTMVEIRDHETAQNGEPHSQTDRRVRDLRTWFHLAAERRGRQFVYRLDRGAETDSAPRKTIPQSIRGRVLSPQRCAQCGRTPSEDDIKLEVDHKVPHRWGGTDDIENLQPLCIECNHDKQAFYSSMDPYETQIRAASGHVEPHRRIGELLKAFYDAGAEAPSELVGVVASMHQYQEDWQKRMRELRMLGWDYETIKRRENGRTRSYYRLTAFADWPSGSIAAEIKRVERLRKRGETIR